MNVFPGDIAEEMKGCAYRASWYASNTREGYEGDAGVDKVAFNDYAESFKKRSAAILSAETCDNMKEMFFYAAWYAANKRWGYDDDAKKDWDKMETYYQNIRKKQELSENLASDLKEMGRSAGWYCANKRYGYDEAAMVDKAKFESFSQKIVGTVHIVAVNFFADAAKILKNTPIVLTEQTFSNAGDIEQSDSFTYSHTEGWTSSWSTTLSFTFGVETTFKAGFLVGNEFQLSLEISGSQTFSGSKSGSITKEYNFPLKVPAHSTYVAKATVHEAEMDVPYEMIFDFGGAQKSIYGTWQGVASSAVTHDIKKA